MKILLLFCFLFLAENVFAQVNFNFIDFKVEERDSATAFPCNLLVKSKTDSFLIQNIEKQKNIAVSIDSTTKFVFIKGQKIIDIYQVIKFCMPSEKYHCKIIFDSDQLCALVDYWEGSFGLEDVIYDQSKKHDFDRSHCQKVDFKLEWEKD